MRVLAFSIIFFNIMAKIDNDTIQRVLERADIVEVISDFVTLDGSEGGYTVHLRVYGRQGEPCARCGATLERMVQGGRSTFFCPHCQK